MDEAIRFEMDWCVEGHGPELCIVLSGPVAVSCLLDAIENEIALTEYLQERGWDADELRRLRNEEQERNEVKEEAGS